MLTKGGWFYTGNSYECSDGVLYLSNITLEQSASSNELEVLLSGGPVSSCNASLNAFVSYASLVGLIGIMILLGLVVSYLFGWIDKKQLSTYGIVSMIVMLILIAFLIIMGIVIINTFCTAIV